MAKVGCSNDLQLEGVQWPACLSLLPPFLRVLVLTDGTVTRSLEAYFGERIEIVAISQVEVASGKMQLQLATAPEEPVLKRRVFLRGSNTTLVYACAESEIAYGRFPIRIMRGLTEERKGIGQLISEARLETHRELKSVRRESAGCWAKHLGVASNESVVIRDYGIYSKGEETVHVEEVFPEVRFISSQ